MAKKCGVTMKETYWCLGAHDLVAIFDPRTGEVVAGPPSRPLPVIRLRQDGDTLYALEEVPQ